MSTNDPAADKTDDVSTDPRINSPAPAERLAAFVAEALDSEYLVKEYEVHAAAEGLAVVALPETGGVELEAEAHLEELDLITSPDCGGLALHVEVPPATEGAMDEVNAGP